MSQLDSISAKYQSVLAETCRLATSSEFCNSARLACEYIHLVSPDYGMLGSTGKLETFWLVNPETQLENLHHFTLFYLILPLKTPTTSSKEGIESQITKARDEIIRAKNSFFGSAQKSKNALRKLEFQEKRLARFNELESHVSTWRSVLGSFDELWKELVATRIAMASAKVRNKKQIEFENLHGTAYAKASALDRKTRQRAATAKDKLKITEKCPYCDGPLGPSPSADHIYPVKRGGLSTIENMIYCCQTCNFRKGDKGLLQFLMTEGLDISVVYETLRTMGKRI